MLNVACFLHQLVDTQCYKTFVYRHTLYVCIIYKYAHVYELRIWESLQFRKCEFGIDTVQFRKLELGLCFPFRGMAIRNWTCSIPKIGFRHLMFHFRTLGFEIKLRQLLKLDFKLDEFNSDSWNACAIQKCMVLGNQRGIPTLMISPVTSRRSIDR